MNKFIPKIINDAKTKTKLGLNIDVKILIMEQRQDGRKFNRGALLNAGMIMAKKMELNEDIVILHDIDLLPTDVMIKHYYEPLGKDKKIRHLAHNWMRYGGNNKSYLGGITLFDSEYLRKLNGFPTYFSGWGGEDDALRNRVKITEKFSNVTSDMEKIVEYPPDIPEDGLIDLENIDKVRDKREILKKSDKLDNKEKFEQIDLDYTIYEKNNKYNGINNEKELIIKSDIEKNDDENIFKITVRLNKLLRNYKFIEENYRLGKYTDSPPLIMKKIEPYIEDPEDLTSE